MEKSDRRYQIFISSTFEDLRDQRKQAVEVIFERGHIPIALERFSASNQNDLEVIKYAISDCQIYILILGHRYGELVPKMNISFTELEYNIAEKNGLLILPFILKKDEIDTLRKELDSKKTKENDELKNLGKLENFHNRIKRFRKLWGKEDQFKYLVGTALNDNLDKCKKPGFVREYADDAKELLASASKNEFIVDTVDKLKQYKKLYTRCSLQTNEKRELSSRFREYYLDRIIKNEVSLFFESGSTIAYLAREISETLSKVVKIEEKGKPNIYISTNNILAYLQLMLISKVPCTTFPWSPPLEETYGALYGGLEKIQLKQPRYDLTPLEKEAKDEIARLMETPFSLSTLSKPSLLLGATSGLQIGNNHKIKFIDDIGQITREQLEVQVNKCFGPHIGSYHNKIFKRFMYETKIPIMIFITGNKIDCEIKVGETYFVLDSEFTWEYFCKYHPLAFCVGCNPDDSEQYFNIFKNLGFEISHGSACSSYTAFFARNSEFIKQFEDEAPC